MKSTWYIRMKVVRPHKFLKMLLDGRDCQNEWKGIPELVQNLLKIWQHSQSSKMFKLISIFHGSPDIFYNYQKNYTSSSMRRG